MSRTDVRKTFTMARPVVERRAGAVPSERDLLIQVTNDVKHLNETVLELKGDIKEIKEDSTKRVDNLEKEKIDKTEVDKMKQDADEIHKDLRDDVDTLKTRINVPYGVLFVLVFVIPMIIDYLIRR